MPEMSKVVTPKFKGDKNPREKILKLGQKITDRIGHKVTSDDPEYWGLACIVSDEMADVALAMDVRVPTTFKEIQKKTGMEEKKLESLLYEMSCIGLLEYNWENEKHEKQYVLPMFVPGSAEFVNMNKQNLVEHPELASFFERMSFLPLTKVTPMVPPGGAGIGMHVIPVEKAINMENKSDDIEHISYWLKKYEGHYALGICSCRLSRGVLKEGCADNPEEWCIGVGDMADYLVETHKGRKATYEEVMAVLKRAEDNGFVHQITNIDGKGKIFAICNCNVNICNALRTSQLFNTPNMSRSSYVARVDSKNCVACGKCVEYCPAGAVKLGQKLCTKNGPIKYPKHILPDNLSWGEDRWDEDYRDNNRKNCYDTGTAPCKVNCPAHIAVQGYLKMAAQGRYKDALALIKKDNPFPAVCGRICNKKCEQACTRGEIDQAVSIDAVKKFIAEQDLKAEHRYVPEIVVASNMGRWKEKIAIIGGGPAGLSCAFYLAQKGYYPTVFEKNKLPGGMLTYGIPSYKLEKDVIFSEIDVLKEMGVTIKTGIEVGKDITIDQLRKEGYVGFYIAIGCQGGRLPEIPGEEASGVETAISFLARASENHDQKLDGDVVVVGGGNVAIDAARTSTRFGASSVKMYCLETRDIMPATKEEIEEAEEENVVINCGYGPKEVLKDENGSVKGIIFKKCTRVFDDEGKFSPMYDENDCVEVPCKHVIFSIGQKVLWGDLLKDNQIELNRNGTAVCDSLTYQTNVRDIFVGGDVHTGPKFAINAIAEGKDAAESLHRFVQVNASLTIGRNRRDFIELDKKNALFDNYDNAGRQVAGMDENIDYKKSFKDAHKTLSEEQVKVETARCLGCGASIVDENKCIGCGVCTTKCEFDAIHLYREHPECSNLIKSEDKLKAILPYATKRGLKIKFGKKTPEEKEAQKEHKEFVKKQKEAKKEAK